MTQTRTKPRPLSVTPRVKVWLEANGEYVFGFGMSEILKAIEAAGSIKEAAAQLEKSYRYIWGRIKEAEKSLGHPLVESRVGGQGTSRSHLTPLAERLVTDYDALRRRMHEVVDQEFASCFEIESQ